MDGGTIGLAQAPRHPEVRLRTGVRVRRLPADGARVAGVELTTGEVLSAPLVALAAGAVNTAAPLLASADAGRPVGLANRSDRVGRNFMRHNPSAVPALHSWRRNDSVHQETIQANGF